MIINNKENKERAFEVLLDKGIVEFNPEGTFYFVKRRLDYGELDLLGEEDINFESKNWKRDILEDYFYEYDFVTLDYVEEEMKATLLDEEIKKNGEREGLEREIGSLVREMMEDVGLDYSLVIEGLDSLEVEVNLTMSTYNERNSDHTIYMDIVENLEDETFSRKMLEDSGLGMLLETQGYKVENLFEDVESDFLRSVDTELYNIINSMNVLSITSRITLGELEKMRKGNFEKIIIGKNSTVGLVDFWNGGGSVLGIELEKDIELEEVLFNASYDDGDRRVNVVKDGYYGYTLKSIYGVDCKNTIEVI